MPRHGLQRIDLCTWEVDAGSSMIHVVQDERYREHVGPDGHPERPERLLAVDETLARYREHWTPAPSRPAEDPELLRVHDAAHLATLEECVGRSGRLDADTFISPRSSEVARLAAGSVIDLSKRVARGEAQFGLAAVRPPGHHAESGQAMGFCLLNNVAIAARALQAEEGVGKILIFDWDTQQFTDQSRRDGARQIRDQIHLAALGHTVEQIIRNRVHARAPRLDGTRRKGLFDELTQSRVSRRVLQQHEQARTRYLLPLAGNQTVCQAHA